MKNSRSLIAVSFMLLPALAEAAFQSEADRIPVLVMPSEVTVDGEERPALGRSFTDTLTGGLLKSGGFSVIDYLSNGPIAAEIAKAPTGSPPERSAGQFGQLTGAHLIYVPRLVVEDDYLRMTVKKIRVNDGAVLAVYESEARGERATMFTLADDVLEQIYAELTLERAGRSAAQRRLRKAGENPVESLEPAREPEEAPAPAKAPELPTEPAPEKAPESGPPPPADDPPLETASGAKPALLAMAAKKPAGKEPATRDIGTVTSVNRDYAFCILTVVRGAEIAVGDEVRVLIDDPLVPMVKLRVSKIDGRQAVAERVSGAAMDRLVPGQSAFRIGASDQ